MAYLYADPIVRKREDGKIVPVENPLDLEGEYNCLKYRLKQTGKQFVIKKEAVNYQSLQQIIKKNPKIIHISSHGAFDYDLKEFFLAIEDYHNGMEDRFSQQRL